MVTKPQTPNLPAEADLPLYRCATGGSIKLPGDFGPKFYDLATQYHAASSTDKAAIKEQICFTRYDVCYAYRIELPGDYPAPDPWWHLARYDGRLHLLLDEQEHQAAANGEPAPELGPYAHTRPPVTTRATD